MDFFVVAVALAARGAAAVAVKNVKNAAAGRG